MQYSIVSYNSLEHSYKRLDAEFYQPIYLELDKELSKYSIKTIAAIAKVTDGEHGSVDLLDDGIKYLTAENIKEGFVDLSKVRYVSNEVDERNKRARVNVGDILISIKGTLGEVAIANKSLLPANMNRDVAIIKLISHEFTPEYLAVFLMSRIGNLQAVREGSGGVQQMITLGRLKNIKFPIVSKRFQDFIKIVLSDFNKCRDLSTEKYAQAQMILLSELGLLEWRPKHKLSFVKKSSDLNQAERMDAEYFQPKYEKIEKVIKSYHGGFSLIKDEFEQNKETFENDDEKTYQYVEIGSVNVSTGEVIAKKVRGINLPANAKRVLKKGDVIVSKVRTYRGAITVIEKNGFVGSGAFTALRENGRINRETLMVFFAFQTIVSLVIKTQYRDILPSHH